MRILVTGGAGYLGSVFCRLGLAAGHQVVVLDSLRVGGTSLLGVWSDPGFRFVRGDVRDADLVRGILPEVDAVVHLAALVGDPLCSREPEDAEAVNRDASLRLIDLCRQAGTSRFLFASTCSNYGRMEDPTRHIDESSDARPISLYARTKVDVEHALFEGGGEGAPDPTVLRFATLFGLSPRMRFDLTVNEFTAAMFGGELEVFGEQFWRPYLHVRDAARAILAILTSDTERLGHRVFNVGVTEQNYTKAQLVDLLRVCLPEAAAARVRFVRKDEDPRDYRVSFARVEEVLGFRPTRSVEDGIREIAEAIRNGVVADPSDPAYRN